ncbi:MAG: hypothetical protein AAF086_03020 [Planctomycetota bacterium]
MGDKLLSMPMNLGQVADDEGAIDNGRYVRATQGKARVTGSWDLTGHLQEGESYMVSGKVRVVNRDTGEANRGRVLVRFGTTPNLTTLNGESASTLFDKTITEETPFQGFATFSSKTPQFGIFGIDVYPNHQVEITELTIGPGVAPWEIIPHRNDKRLLINDQLAEPNALVPFTIGIAPGATQAHVKVTYALPEILATAGVKANVSHRGAKGFNAKNDIVPPEGMFFWRDGDDHDHWITFDIKNPSSRVGDKFRGSIKGSGIAGKWYAFDFEVKEGAVNELPSEMPYHRPPYRLVLPDTPTQDLDMTSVEWSESGMKDGQPVWRSRPSHGYSNSSNGESGLYLPWEEKGVMGKDVHTLQTDEAGRPYVLMRTRKLDEVFEINGKTFPHQATMLQGQKLDEWCHRVGVYSAQLLLPSRKGAWSAFWVVGRSYPSKGSMWPPEIDFFESFNGAFGAEYTPDTSSSGQHAGAHGSNKRERVDGFHGEMIQMGFASDFNYYTQIHDFTTVIEDDWVTHFRDGIEFSRQRNTNGAIDGNKLWDFYPIVNVAVRGKAEESYSDGTGDMRWYGLQYYGPESGYSLEPYTESKPYPNGELLPRPDPKTLK